MNLYFSDRIYLGTMDLAGMTTEPTNPPSGFSSKVENVQAIQIDSLQIVNVRFNVILVTFEEMTPTSALVVPYCSRVNPNATNWGVTDPTADKWVSYGGSTVQKVPDGNGGNAIEIRARGCKYITFKTDLVSGGGASLPARLYGLAGLERVS